jgi:succinylglutamic semialdehyde dehydrogenase
MDPAIWQNRSPGDLSITLDEIAATPVDPAVEQSRGAFQSWSRTPIDKRIKALRACQSRVRSVQDELARSISVETGKPIREARGELAAVVAKFDLTISDAREILADREISDGAHPAVIRRLARGPAAVIAPFNFPIHLGHGAAVAYLIAGNTVLFKPSPLAAATCARYAAAMQACLPPGVFTLVQGWGETGRALCLHPGVRSVCFTGSIPVGTALARDLAADYSKSLALELGGKNAAVVLDDADVPSAASAVADAMCLTAGQRCNATSRVLVAAPRLREFAHALLGELSRYVPGPPIVEATTLGPLVNEAAVSRYLRLGSESVGRWIAPASAPREAAGRRGHYVTPAVAVCTDPSALAASPLLREESFAPILTISPFDSDDDAIAQHDATPFGLVASIFTASESRFHAIGDRLGVGNLYWNLPTTLSPSTLPFGGLGISGNGKPGARGFVRFAADEQAVQWKASSNS